MIRRLKKDVLTELPDKQRQKVYVETDKSIIKEIKEILGSHSNKGNLESMVMDMLHSADSDDN